MTWYKKNKLVRIAINFLVPFLLITIGVPSLLSPFDDIMDRFDERQHISITFTQKEYTYNKCDTLKFDVEVASIIDEKIDIEYRADNVAGSLSTIEPLNYVTIKSQIPQTKGVNNYTTVGFVPQKSCEWQSGDYVVKLIYRYNFRKLARTFSTQTNVKINQ